jgi:hypothetical protein
MELEPFVRYRTQLAALASGESVRLALQRAPFWPSHLQWTPIFERFFNSVQRYSPNPRRRDRPRHAGLVVRSDH